VEGADPGCRVRADPQVLDHRDERRALGGLDPAATLGHHQTVGDFERP
jgi:hypothetical protein